MPSQPQADCNQTPSNPALIISSSGNYKAVYDKKGNRWRINDKNNKSIGTRKSREDAISDLEALEGGTHKSQSGNFKDHRMRGGSGRVSAASTTVYAQPTREGNYKGRGNNLKRTAPEKIVAKDCSPTKLARKLINQCTNGKVTMNTPGWAGCGKEIGLWTPSSSRSMATVTHFGCSRRKDSLCLRKTCGVLWSNASRSK
jgi:hypothetical protein